jgi:hypothetical protein
MEVPKCGVITGLLTMLLLVSLNSEKANILPIPFSQLQHEVRITMVTARKPGSPEAAKKGTISSSC